MPSLTEQDPRWTAVTGRDASRDGTFVYAVKTTGIFCRPSCPSRRAKPGNVAFYATPAEAEVAGFRPCLRCAPNATSRAQAHAAMVAQACRQIEVDSPVSLEVLAANAGLSPFHFHRLFKQATGLTPREYAKAKQSQRVRESLAQTGRITDAIYDAGFSSGSRFYERSNEVLGMTPTTFRAGGTDTAITFAVGQCSLGAILVARSDKGICAILIGDDADTLTRDLQDRFPKADLAPGNAAFDAWVAKVVGFVDTPAIGLDLPLDIRGTAFQQRVWQALREIPPGSTASYTEVAKRLGLPKSVRAIAQACGANPIAVAIPCHRVVRHDGGLSGYRWGVERKRALLDRERG